MLAAARHVQLMRQVAKCSYGFAVVQLQLRWVQLFEQARKLWMFSFWKLEFMNFFLFVSPRRGGVDDIKYRWRRGLLKFFSSSSFWYKSSHQLWKQRFQYCTFRRNSCTLRSKSCTSIKSMLHRFFSAALRWNRCCTWTFSALATKKLTKKDRPRCHFPCK